MAAGFRPYDMGPNPTNSAGPGICMPFDPEAVPHPQAPYYHHPQTAIHPDFQFSHPYYQYLNQFAPTFVPYYYRLQSRPILRQEEMDIENYINHELTAQQTMMRQRSLRPLGHLQIQPVMQPPVPRNPAVGNPAVKHPVVKTPVVRNSVAKTQVTRNPVAKTPVVRTPLRSQAVRNPELRVSTVKNLELRTPLMKSAAVRSPAVRNPELRHPVVTSPAIKSQAIGIPELKNPIQRQPVARNPVTIHPVARNPVSRSPVAINPVARNPVTINSVTIIPVAREPVKIPAKEEPQTSPPKQPIFNAQLVNIASEPHSSKNLALLMRPLSPVKDTVKDQVAKIQKSQHHYAQLFGRLNTMLKTLNDRYDNESVNVPSPPLKRPRKVSTSSSGSHPPESASANEKDTLAQYPQRVKQEDGTAVYKLGPNGTQITASQFSEVFWTNAPVATRCLLCVVFTSDELATHTLTGKPSPAFYGRERPPKLQLDQQKVDDIVTSVINRTGGKERVIRATITTKCADTAKKYKRRAKKALQIMEE